MRAAALALSVSLLGFIPQQALADTLAPIIIVEKDEADKTIGELKPAYIDFSYRVAPRTPLNEVALRYSRLIREASDPEVRIKALHRLINLEELFYDAKPQGLIDDEIWSIAIESYEALLQRQPGDKDNDRILYQLARACGMLGRTDKALTSLERLVGQYPRSTYTTEAWFRIGELRYSAGEYIKAQSAYSRVLADRGDGDLASKARYMLGWTQFKQENFSASLQTFLQVLSHLESNSAPAGQMAPGVREAGDDALRIVSIMASYGKGPETLKAAIALGDYRPLAPKLYAALYDYYLQRERYQDAAASAQAYIAAYPAATDRSDFHDRIIAAYDQGGLPSLAWEEKARFTRELGLSSNYWNSQQETAKTRLRPSLYQYLDDLGQREYALGLKAAGVERRTHLQNAVAYFDGMEEIFPSEGKTAEALYLQGEAYFLLEEWELAVRAYDKAGYFYPDFPQRHEAAYAGVNALSKAVDANQEDATLRSRRVDALLRFAKTFPRDTRATESLLFAANELYAMEQYGAALDAATQTASFTDDKATRNAAWTVAGHSAFALSQYQDSEHAYRQALSLRSRKAPDYDVLMENFAASIYSQGEQAEARGEVAAAFIEYKRVIDEAPESQVRISAQYDAGMRAIDLGRWKEAIALLNDFRQRYPNHKLTAGIGEKLVYAYQQHQRPESAADELLRIAAGEKDAERKRKALLQAAELMENAGREQQAAKVYLQYANEFPAPFETAIQVRDALIDYYAQSAQMQQADQWREKLIQFEESGDAERTPASRSLAAEASWTLAQKEKAAFDDVRLTLPLSKSLAAKQAALKKVMQRLNRINGYGVSEYATAATYMMGEVYRQLGRDIMESNRPGNLSDLEREQYSLLLEEQAFPFEEKAIEFLELNASRTQQGVYDEWVKKSYLALREIMPARYDKQEVKVDVAQTLQ
ncbi:tetratricopeptide repeat protein [Hahella sp. NBU794]|uniref:tetratricopeptide repeat protein n=1 Tax=Hahella sp. NBU794 TaxID=3422590 RepID=UPI003D6FC30B